MSDAIQINTLLPFQRALVENPARFTHNNWSRQTGKSFASSLRRVIRGIRRKRNQVLLSAGQRQSNELMQKVRQHIEVLQLAMSIEEREYGFDNVKYSAMEITLKDLGIRIIGLPANPLTARGYTGDVLLDEFAMHQHDREIWASVFPTVLRGDGELDICSTPKGRANQFYRLASNEEFSHSTVTIDDAIAQGLKVDREALRLAMGDDELFRQEFLCEFVDEASAFLTYELIGTCERPELPVEFDAALLDKCNADNIDVVIGMDIGRKRDLTVIWPFACVPNGSSRRRSESTLRSLGPIILKTTRFADQTSVLDELLSRRCVRKACIDASGLGMQLAETAVEKHGSRVEGCIFTMLLKSEIALKMRTRMEDAALLIAPDHDTRNDLHSVEKSVTADGNIRLKAPREEGSHADRFWAAALACHAASGELPSVEIYTRGTTRMGSERARAAI